MYNQWNYKRTRIKKKFFLSWSKKTFLKKSNFKLFIFYLGTAG